VTIHWEFCAGSAGAGRTDRGRNKEADKSRNKKDPNVEKKPGFNEFRVRLSKEEIQEWGACRKENRGANQENKTNGPAISRMS